MGAVERIGLPAVLKTRRLGYDGKGQFRLKTQADIDAAWAALGEAAGQVGLILERIQSILAKRHTATSSANPALAGQP